MVSYWVCDVHGLRGVGHGWFTLSGVSKMIAWIEEEEEEVIFDMLGTCTGPCTWLHVGMG